MAKKNFITYKCAQELCDSNNIKTMAQYIDFSKDYDLLPSRPQDTYNGKGWISWGNFLKTGNKSGGRLKYHVNHDFFKVWSHDMAYVLGFWFADGHIYCPNKTFILDQHDKDKPLIEKIAGIMGSDRPVQVVSQKVSKMARMVVVSSTIVEDIIKLGGKENKSLDILFPVIPKKYLPDFVRGYFDGDGSIWYAKHHRCHLSNFTCGSYEFIHGLFEELTRNIPDFRSSLHIEKRGTCVLCMAKNSTIKLGKFMYHDKDVIKMERKYLLFNK
ncbi:MAG: hypothetical protein WC119_03290 [Synergistaceae bacterium]